MILNDLKLIFDSFLSHRFLDDFSMNFDVFLLIFDDFLDDFSMVFDRILIDL